MNDDEIIADYYDSDHPFVGEGPPSNWDEQSLAQGTATDVPFYVGVARAAGKRVLDVGAGTGRITAGLVRARLRVTAIEPSPSMRRRLGERVARFDDASRVRIAADVSGLKEESFDCAILGLGVLACLPTLDEQLALLRTLRRALRPGGVLALDVPDAIALGAPHPTLQPTWVRVHVERKARYARVAQRTALKSDQTLSIHGYYDEDGRDRAPFSFRLRLLFPGELRLALEAAGLRGVRLSGAVHRSEVGAGPRVYALGTASKKRGGDEVPFWSELGRGVAETALASAAARAMHTTSMGPGPCDPFALRLAGERGHALLVELGGHAIAGSFVARAAWFDDRVAEAVSRGARSIVSLGAGLCTRSLRVARLRGVPTYEIDSAEVLAYKEARLIDQPAKHIRRIALDLARVEAVALASEKAESARVIVAEGVVPYLVPEIARALVRLLSASLGPGEELLFDAPDDRVPLAPGMQRFLADRGLAYVACPVGEWLEGDRSLELSTTHLGAPDACVGLPRSSLGGSLLHRVRRL